MERVKYFEEKKPAHGKIAKQQVEETQKLLQPKINEIVGYYERQIDKTNTEADNA